MRLNRSSISIVVLIIFYFVGVVGVLFGDAKSFLLLTPANLLLTLFILLINDRNINTHWRLFLITALGGLAIEIIGVNTAFPFGHYSYGATLGWKLFQTPFIIGVNWLLLIYATNSIASYANLTAFSKSMLAAVLMVLLDFLIEPVAIAFDFWTWTAKAVPIENYIAWFLISFGMSLFWQRSQFAFKQSIGITIYLLQVLFFGCIFLWA